jgi:hypothetical protein
VPGPLNDTLPRAGRRAGQALAAMTLALLLAACGSLGPPAPSSPPSDRWPDPQEISLTLDGEAHRGHWLHPSGEARALVVLAHGYTRRCAHLAGIAQRLAAAGLPSLCIDASMAGGGAPALARALADRLLDGTDPQGRPWPARTIVAGHSAGAVFALRLGQRLAAQAPERLVGALLFDPVATPDFGEALARVSDDGRRPVLALRAPPHRCNAQGNAGPALREAARRAREAGRDTLELPEPAPGGTHADVEGDHSDWLAIAACGRPVPQRVAELHDRAIAWVRRQTDGAAPPHTLPSAPFGPPGAEAPRRSPPVTHATMPPCPTCVN